MKNWFLRARRYGLSIASSGLFLLGGCALSDQQLATIWSSVLTTGLNTVVSTVIAQAVPSQG